MTGLFLKKVYRATVLLFKKYCITGNLIFVYESYVVDKNLTKYFKVNNIFNPTWTGFSMP